MDFNDLDAPSDGIEYDIAGAPDDIKVEGRAVEVVDGPTDDPYGTLIVRLVGSSETRTYTRLEPGWEHPMQVVEIVKTGTTVTRVRVWK